AEVVYAARAELARSVDDVLSRRTRARLFARDASVDAAEAVGAILGQELNLTEAELERSVAEYLAAVRHEKSVLLEGAAA
ncbi:glycerol-3-phosphate dehydrogenase C-terminal domain-containing protein, partial [Streptomyces sp. MCAF7]